MNLEEDQVAELLHLLRQGRGAHTNTASKRHIQLPEKLYKVLLRIVQDLADGKAISLTPTAQELTTQEAANFLGMARQFLVRLLEGGKIPFHRVGTHRRVYLRDLLTFRNERDRRRHDAIQQMARDAVKDGVYDDFWLPNPDPSDLVAVLDARGISKAGAN